MSNEYPHLLAKNPKGELLYIWVKTDMYPANPSVLSIENPEEVIKLAMQFNATPVFAGIKLTIVSTNENDKPNYGGQYLAEFTGFKMIGQ